MIAHVLELHMDHWPKVQVYSWFIQILTCVCDNPLPNLETGVVVDRCTDGQNRQSDYSNALSTLCGEG